MGQKITLKIGGRDYPLTAESEELEQMMRLAAVDVDKALRTSWFLWQCRRQSGSCMRRKSGKCLRMKCFRLIPGLPPI